MSKILKNPKDSFVYNSLLLIVVIAIFWQILSIIVNENTLVPSLYYLLTNSFPEIALFGGYGTANFYGALLTILFHILISLYRLVIGVALGFLLGFTVGLSIYKFDFFKKGNEIVLSILRYIPLLALIPLFLQWFSGKEIGIIIYIAFSVFVLVATHVYEAANNVDQNYIRLSNVLGANQFQTYFKIIIPATFPELSGAFRNIIGLCWAFSLGAEYLAAREGIGFLLYQSYLFADMGKMLVIGFVYIILGLVTYGVFKSFVNYKLRWLNN